MSEDLFSDLGAVMGNGEIDPGSKLEPGPAGEDTGTGDVVELDDESAMESASAESVDPCERPVSEFDGTIHKAPYVLEAVVSEFDDVITHDVECESTHDHGPKGVTKSELHNVALAVATEYPEEIAEHVLEQHGAGDEDSE